VVIAAKLRNDPSPNWIHLLVLERNFIVHRLVFLGVGGNAGFAIFRIGNAGAGHLLLVFRKT
jgi:hypothetical protein